MDNFVKLDDLYASQLSREQEKEKLYSRFLRNCNMKIKKMAKEYKQSTCVYEVPPFEVGTPPYDHKDLTRYICQKLKHNGFAVSIQPNTFYTVMISWRPEDFNINAYKRTLNVLESEEKRNFEKRVRNFDHPTASNDNNTAMIQYNIGKHSDIVPVNMKKFKGNRLPDNNYTDNQMQAGVERRIKRMERKIM